MKKTRKLCAIMIDTIGRELTINRPTVSDHSGWPTFDKGISVKANDKVLLSSATLTSSIGDAMAMLSIIDAIRVLHRAGVFAVNETAHVRPLNAMGQKWYMTMEMAFIVARTTQERGSGSPSDNCCSKQLLTALLHVCLACRLF